MSAEHILQTISDEFGLNWTAESMLAIACDYIDNQQDENLFEEIVREAANLEANADVEVVVPKQKMSEEDVQNMFRKHKAALTKAKNSGDLQKVIDCVKKAESEWEESGWPFPDAWNIFSVARREAKMKLQQRGDTP